MTSAPACFGDAPSRAEARVAIALLFGHTAEETAHELRMGRLQTVNGHRHRLYVKFGAHGAGDLAAILTRGAGR